MMVQEKPGLVLPKPVFETIRQDVLVPVSWNFKMSPALMLAIKLREI
jgi:hypothetical protein